MAVLRGSGDIPAVTNVRAGFLRKKKEETGRACVSHRIKQISPSLSSALLQSEKCRSAGARSRRLRAREQAAVVWTSWDVGFSRGAARLGGASEVPDGERVNMGKTWALPEGSQRSRHATVRNIQMSQRISLKLVFFLTVILQPAKMSREALENIQNL